MDFSNKIFIFILITVNAHILVAQNQFLSETLAAHSSTDLTLPCIMGELNYFFHQRNTLRNPLIVLKPTIDDISFNNFISFVQQSSEKVLWPYVVYDNPLVYPLIPHRDANIILFVSSPNDVTQHLSLEHLKYNDIYIIYSNKTQTDVNAFKIQIGKIFNSMSMRNITRGIVLAERASKVATWRVYAPLEQNCAQRNGFKLISLCHFNGSDVDIIRSSNLHKGCALNVLISENLPFTYYDGNKGFRKGIDIALIYTLAQKLKLNLNFLFGYTLATGEESNG